ncbi:MAG: LacI family DNA-binding transcriptional regulator, partial [Anaerolineales bacterium]
MPTVRELAEQPGISVATISRALNNKPGISPDTRQKVLQLTGELQYSPNLAARNLTTSRTYNVLFLTAVANFSRRRILFTLHYA